MNDLLSAWKCKVYSAISAEQAIEIYLQHEEAIDIVLVDYQLATENTTNVQPTEQAFKPMQNNSERHDIANFNGIELIKYLRAKSHYPLPAILITATTDESVLAQAQQADIGYLRKIVKPISLRALMSSLLTKELERNYIPDNFKL